MANDLWNILPHPSPDHVVRLFWMGPNSQRGGDYARNERELARFIDSTAGNNAYVAPNPTTSTIGSRHSAADVTHWSYMLIDVDPLAGEVSPRPFLVMPKALALLGEWLGETLRPVIIDSGRGAQAWIRLEDRPFEEGPDGLSRTHARKAMGYWLRRLADEIDVMEGCKIDTSTSDLPRLMRCPGTANMKTGRRAAIVDTGASSHPGITEKLLSFVPAAVYQQPERGAYQQGRKWQYAFSDMTITAQQYLMYGQDEPGRHKAMWHTACSMSEVGCDRSEAYRAIVRANSLRGPENELPISEIDRALDKVYEEKC